MISFIKTYPYKFDLNENGDTIIDKNSPGHQVVYEGYFNDEEGNWSGDWEIKISEEPFAKEIYEFQFVNGPWQMRLVEDFE